MEKWQRLLLAIYCATSYQKPSKISSGSEKWDIIAWDIRLQNFGPNWAQIAQLCYAEIWPMLPLPIYCTPSCQNTFKKVCGRLWHVRLNNFEPNWAQIVLLLERWFFGGKLTDATIFYLFCPIKLQFLKKFLRVGQIMRYKVLQFWAKSGKNHSFTNKGDFIERFKYSAWNDVWNFLKFEICQKIHENHVLNNKGTITMGIILFWYLYLWLWLYLYNPVENLR